MDKRTIFLIGLNLLLWALLYFTRRKKKLSNTILFFASFLFFLSIIEFAYRAFSKKNCYTITNIKEFNKYDSVLGHTMTMAGEFCVTKTSSDTIFKSTYTIISDSAENYPNFNHRIGFSNPGSAKEIIFLGCSFTFGEGLEDTESLPYRTGKITQTNAINLGCMGYGLHQVYQLFDRKYAGIPNEQRIFVYSFLYDHILRANGVYNWNEGSPFFSVIGDSLIHSGSLSANILKPENKYIHYISMLGTFSFLKNMLEKVALKSRVNKLRQIDYDRCFLMINKMASHIKRTGGKLIIIDWDRKDWANSAINDLPGLMIEKQLNDLSDLNVNIIRVSSVMDLNDKACFIPNDGHPTAFANEKLASAIAAIIE